MKTYCVKNHISRLSEHTVAVFVFILSSSLVQGQSYDAVCTADAQLNYNTVCADWQNMNVGSTNSLIVADWTWNTIGCGVGSVRGLYRFDLSVPSLPNEIYDNRARLLLFFPQGNPFQHQHFAEPPGNEMQIQRVTTPWAEATVTWANQPAFIGVNAIVSPSTNSPSDQDFDLDISPMVNDWLCGGAPNYGVSMKQLFEGTIYRNVNLTTREWPIVDKRPRIVLEFAQLEAIGPDTICSGDSVTFSAGLSNAASPEAYSFTWSVDNNTFYTGPTIFLDNLTPGLHNIDLIAENTTCFQAVDFTTVWVAAQPVSGPIFHD